MKSTMLMALIAACAPNGSPGRADTGDTGIPDTTGGVTTPPATTPPGTTPPVTTGPTTTGPVATPGGRYRGCAPVYAPPPVDLADCVSFATYDADPTRYTETRYDGAGRPIEESVTPVPYDSTTTWTWDALTGELLSTVRVEDAGDRTTTTTYGYTYDPTGALIERTAHEEVDNISFPDSASDHLWTYTHSACGVEIEEYSIGGVPQRVYTWEHFTDGVRRSDDSDADGTTDAIWDDFVDPVTGQMASTEHDYEFAHPGPEEVRTWTWDVATGQVAEIASDSAWAGRRWTQTSTYDADGRITRFVYDQDFKGLPPNSYVTDYTWSCPP